MAGADGAENTAEVDPYRNYRFRVLWEGRTIAGISKVGGLTGATSVIRHRDGSSAMQPQSPRQTNYGTITLEHGITQDKDFVSWANKVWDYAGDTKRLPPSVVVSPADFRRDLTLHMHNEAGQLVIAYLIHRCWVSEFTALPSLDGGGNAVAIQRVTLENEGWDHVGPNTLTLEA